MVGDNLGMINKYECGCGHNVVTIDKDSGSTRFFIPCPDCGDWAYSSYYTCDQELVPTHEWYSPEDSELPAFAPDVQEYCRQGGLVLREIDYDRED